MISIPKPEFKTIQPADKVEQALSALQEFIISGNLKPGTELLPESVMAKQLGVSKSSLADRIFNFDPLSSF